MANSSGMQVNQTLRKSHVVRTQRIELQVANTHSAEQTQARIDKMKSSVLDNLLCELFDANVPDDICINVDTLTIDLGHCVLEENFEHQFAAALSEQLSQFMHTLGLHEYKNGPLVEPENTSKTRTSSQRLLDLLCHYLELGILPWWESDIHWDVQANFDALFETAPEALSQTLSTLKSYTSCLRMAQQLRSEQLKCLLKTWQQHTQLPLISLYELVNGFVGATTDNPNQNSNGDKQSTLEIDSVKKLSCWLANAHKPLALLVWSYCESVRRASPTNAFTQQFIERLLNSISAETLLPKKLVAQELISTTSKASFDANLGIDFEQIIEQLKLVSIKMASLPGRSTKNSINDNQKLQDSEQSQSSSEITEAVIKTPSSDLDPTTNNQDLAQGSDDPGIQTDLEMLNIEKLESSGLGDQKHYLENAGLIMLWPFLGHFFRDAGLTKEGEFSNIENRLRGVLLTQYLVTGQTRFVEHQLLLNKLLCGLAFNIPTPTKLKLTKHEIHAGDELLSSVLHHWQDLGNTSVDGFKQAFLQRQGVLSKQQEHWNLYIERNGYDVLLEQLPWNIGVVSTKWMKSPIYVEW